MNQGCTMIENWSDELDEELLAIPGCDAAAIGIIKRCGQSAYVVYDFDALMEIFVGQGMAYHAALDHIASNIENAWMGPSSPAVLRRPDPS
jgi:hypothetical protein